MNDAVINEVQVNLNKFREAISAVSPAIQQNVTLTIKNDTLIVSSEKSSFAIFRLIKEIINPIPMNVEVDANIIKSTISLFVGETLFIEKSGRTMYFHTENTEKGRIALPFIELGDFDIMNKAKEQCTHEFTVKHLPMYINDTAHALEIRTNALTGSDLRKSAYYLETDGNAAIRVTTTDGHRISVRQGAIQEVKNSFLIPGAELKAAVSIIGNSVTFKISESGEFMLLFGNDTVVIVPMLSESYFNTKAILDKIQETKLLSLVVDREDLILACEIGSITEPKILFEVKGSKLCISNTSTMGSFDKMNLDIEKEPDGKNVHLGFSAKYLSEALKSIRSKRVDILISNNNGACQITAHVEEGEKPKAGKAVEVVLPIKI